MSINALSTNQCVFLPAITSSERMAKYTALPQTSAGGSNPVCPDLTAEEAERQVKAADNSAKTAAIRQNVTAEITRNSASTVVKTLPAGDDINEARHEAYAALEKYVEIPRTASDIWLVDGTAGFVCTITGIREPTKYVYG